MFISPDCSEVAFVLSNSIQLIETLNTGFWGTEEDCMELVSECKAVFDRTDVNRVYILAEGGGDYKLIAYLLAVAYLWSRGEMTESEVRRIVKRVYEEKESTERFLEMLRRAERAGLEIYYTVTPRGFLKGYRPGKLSELVRTSY